MKATKVAILLALIAISVLTLFVMTLIDGSVFGAEVSTGGPTITGRMGESLLEFSCTGERMDQVTSFLPLPSSTVSISRPCPALFSLERKPNGNEIS